MTGTGKKVPSLMRIPSQVPMASATFMKPVSGVK